MNEVISLLPAFVAGVVLGVLFFGGLWLTIRIGLRSKKSALIFTASFILRMAIGLLGFYYVGANSWQKMLVCLGGFLLAKIVITRIFQKNNRSKIAFITEIGDET
jgi:F1F0 ATPase subunit 2